jgi:hypothetical protein
MGHEPTLLSNTKMLEGKLVTKFVNNTFRCSSWQKPPTMDNCILSVYLFQRLGIFVVKAKGLMLISQLRFNQLFGMPIKWLSPVEQTCIFFVHHPYNGIPITVNYFNIIPICLCAVHHESFEATTLSYEHVSMNIAHEHDRIFLKIFWWHGQHIFGIFLTT